MTGSITFGGTSGITITGLPNPINPSDVATKSYVDATSTGFSFKIAVACAAGSNITLSGEQTIDGITTSASRVLVFGQTNQTQNGIYVSASGAWSRSSDANTSGELTNAAVYISAGTSYGNTDWVQITPAPTIGTSNIIWTQFLSGISYSAGTGINLSSNTFSNTGVLSITGTANQITSSASTGAITLSLPSTITGLTSVTSTTFVGALTGNASTASTATSATSATTASNLAGGANGSIPYQTGSGATLMLGVGSIGYVLTVSGGGVPSWAAPSGGGGAVSSITGTANQITASASTGAITLSLPSTITGLTSVTSTTFVGALTGNASTASTANNLASGTTGSIPYQVSSGNTSLLPIGSTGQVLTVSGGNPVWSSLPTTVSSITGTANQITASASTGAISLSLPATITGLTSVTSTTFVGALTGNASTATYVNGGTTGALLYQSAANTTGFLSIGSSNQVLVVSSGNPSWTSTPTLTGTNFTGIPNSALTNSSITIGSTSISLGGSSSTLAGLTTVTATTFVGTLTGGASLDLPLAGGSMTGSITFAGTSGITVTGLPTPINPSDTSTKSYVDTSVAASPWKLSIAVATTANITLSGEQTIDGISTNTSRVLVKNQTTQSQNGIYISNPSSWTRSTDATSSSQLTNAAVYVAQGTVNANTGWNQITANPTIGTSNIVWVQSSGSGTYSAGTGLNLSGGVFSNTGVLSVTGTANQITSNTTSGAVTLSLPATITGLTSVTSTTFVGALTGNASTATTTSSLANGAAGSIPYQTGSGSTSMLATATGVLIGGTTPSYTTTPTLTGTNITGIPNTGLVNDSVTVTAGTGLTGGGTVLLGNTITLTNAGVTSLTAGTNISVSASTGASTISVTGTVPTAAGLTNSIFTTYSATLITSTTTANQIVDSFATTLYRSVKYQVQVTSSTSYQVSEILAFHDGTNTWINEYAIANNSGTIATFTVNIVGGNVQLQVTPTNAVTTIKVAATAITI
jgi:hypothetical protein